MNLAALRTWWQSLHVEQRQEDDDPEVLDVVTDERRPRLEWDIDD